MKIHALWLSASVLSLGWCGAAVAQTPPDQATADSKDQPDNDVVVITAERRESNLQTTAISATVLTGDDLAEKGVMTVDQLQFAAPGATVNNFGQGIDFNIRGIGKAEHNSQTTTGVVTYRDGVATFPGYFQEEPYYDIARVEILRGPQGTFVGQNATGGAVFVTANDPKINGGNHGYIQGQLANYNDIGLQGAANLPISDTMAARVAFNAEARDSFYKISGPFTGDPGQLRSGSARFGLLWQPSDDLSVLWKSDYNDIDMGGYPSDPVLSTNDPFTITANADHAAHDKFFRTSLKVDYTLAGGTKLRSITGYQDGNTTYRADLDGTRTGNSIFANSVDETIYSQEFNLISPDGPVSWVLGAYLQGDEYDFLPNQFLIGVPAGAPATEYRLQGTNPKQIAAVFGQMSLALPAGFELQLGARYSESRTKNRVSVLQYGLPIDDHQTASDDNLSGKVALNWTIDPHNFVYAFAANGFRPGGLNVPVGLGLPDPFGPEKVKEYEIGWKSGMFDGHVRTQIDAYYNDYENFQVSIGYPLFPVFAIEVNNPNPTKISGFEAQTEIEFGDFSLDGGLGIMQSELGTFYATDPRATTLTPCDPNTGPSSLSCINLDGKEQTYAPNLTFNVGAQYEFMLDGGDILTPRLNYGHVSSQWATLFENEARGDKVEARNIVTLQLAWLHGDIITTFYGTNVTDQHYVAAINSGLRFVGPPAQYGVRVTKLF